MVLETLNYNNNGNSKNVDNKRIFKKTQKIDLNDNSFEVIECDDGDNVSDVNEQIISDDDDDKVIAIDENSDVMSEIKINAIIRAVEIVISSVCEEDRKRAKKKSKKMKKRRYSRMSIIEPKVDGNYPDVLFGNCSTIERLNAMQRTVARRVRKEMMILSMDLAKVYKVKCDFERN